MTRATATDSGTAPGAFHEKPAVGLQREASLGPSGKAEGVAPEVKEFVKRNLVEHRETFRELAKR